MKRTILVSLMVLLFSVPSMAVTYPATIMDWEVGTLGNALTIDIQTPSPDAVKLKSGTAVYSNIGVTSGILSLEVSGTGSANQTRALAKGLWRVWDQLKTGTAITMDITTTGTSVPDQTLAIDVQINGTATGWANYMLLGSPIVVTQDQSTTQVTCIITQELRDMIAAAGNTNGDLYITRSHGANGATFWIDNVQVVPEPATLVLLGLGAVSLLRRRK